MIKIEVRGAFNTFPYGQFYDFVLVKEMCKIIVNPQYHVKVK